MLLETFPQGIFSTGRNHCPVCNRSRDMTDAYYVAHLLFPGSTQPRVHHGSELPPPLAVSAPPSLWSCHTGNLFLGQSPILKQRLAVSYIVSCFKLNSFAVAKNVTLVFPVDLLRFLVQSCKQHVPFSFLPFIWPLLVRERKRRK